MRRDADGRIIGTGGGGQEHDEEIEGPEGAVESALLHFSNPRDPATIAAFLRTRVYRPESLVWLDGYQALRLWRTENHITGLHAIPYDTETTVGVTIDFPLGRWTHQQRKALRAGELEERRKKLLDSPEAGMVWEPGEEAWETKLAMLRSYRRAHGHLAPRQDTVWGDAEGELLPVGQHMANLRWKGGLGKDAERAEQRAAQLSAIDEDWCCPWPLDWQRHHRVLADLVDADGVLPAIEPGVLFEGDDLGKWLAQQRKPHTWAQLTGEQQERRTALGVEPAERPPIPVKSGGELSAPFRRGVAALAQYIAREGTTTVKRPHREAIVLHGQEHELALGVWFANQKQRRDKLTQPQRTALAELGIEWAQ